MRDASADKSQYIVESSLTELAFIFFFILLVFSALKIGELVHENENQEQEREVLAEELTKTKKENEQLIASVLPIKQAVNTPREVNPDEIFIGLSDDTEKAVALIDRQNRLESQLQGESITPELLDSYFKAIEILQGTGDGIESTDPKKIAKNITQKLSAVKGQNAALRKKLSKEGNGRVFPPCWADENGKIQYVYYITIMEDKLQVERAWPDELQERVNMMPFISNAIGEYTHKDDFLNATSELFELSVKEECRHFVKVSDKAISKDAFKFFLINVVEAHFYKLVL